MSKQTFADRLAAGLSALGWHRDPTDKSRYDAFRKPGTAEKLFVGPNGALRVGRSASSSRSVGDAHHQTASYHHQTAFYQHLLALGTRSAPPTLADLATEFSTASNLAPLGSPASVSDKEAT